MQYNTLFCIKTKDPLFFVYQNSQICKCHHITAKFIYNFSVPTAKFI